MKNKYDFYKIDKSEYPFSNQIFELIQSSLENVINKRYSLVNEDSKKGKEFCRKLKLKAIKIEDEDSANISFLLERYFDLIVSISIFWNLYDDLEYQKAWTPLQDAIDIVKMLRNFAKDESQLSISKIFKYLTQIEKLYPYVIFNSAEVLIKKTTCSICKRSSFDPNCNHISGELYFGEMAVNKAEDIEIIGLSFVEKPVDKRCINFMDDDKRNLSQGPFRLIHAFVQNSSYPLQDFELVETKKKIPRKFYTGRSEESICPCGSRKLFKDCCFNENFVQIPHYQIKIHDAVVFGIEIP